MANITSSGIRQARLRTIIYLFGGLVILAVLIAALSPHFYFFKRVDPQEIGIKQRGGQIVDIVGPGIYSDVGLFVRLDKYSTAGVQFTTEDPEVITADQQRLGVSVFGTAFRPGLGTDVAQLRQLWTRYQTVYTNDQALMDTLDKLAYQAMKSCVGDKPFQDSVIGSDRDNLGACIDDKLNELGEPFGLTIANVTVPNVTLSPEVQAKLDAITQSRLDTEKAEQDRLKAIAEGAAQQAEQEAAIRVEQSKLQEQARQEITLAQLEKEKLIAEKAVIDAEKANDLLSAQRDLEINQAKAVAATELAKADLAKEIAMAELYSSNPNYYYYQMALANAGAIKDTDKLIFTTEGSFPQLVFGEGLNPVVPVTPATPN